MTVPESMGTILWRLDQAEKKLDKLQDTKADHQDMLDLRDEVRSLKRVLIATALSVTGSSVLFVLGVIQIVGGG